MTKLNEILARELLRKEINEYFKIIEELIDSDDDLDTLTKFFTEKPYAETKPYLTRRKLIPKDGRFNKIEIVYDENKNVKALVWFIAINLTQLKDIFGYPIIQNEPYSKSSAFTFKSMNPKIELIKTRHPEWLTENREKGEFECRTEKRKNIMIANPEFEFIQFNLI